MLNRALSLSLLVTLSGCTLAPKYLRPEAPISGQFPGQSKGSLADPDATQIAWRDFFADPRLNRLVQIGLENNRDLRVSTLNVEQLRAQFRITQSALFPTIEAFGNGTRQRIGADSLSTSSGSAAAAPASTVTTVTGPTGTTTTTTTTTSAGENSNSPAFSTQFNVGLSTTSYEVDLFGRVRSLRRQALEQYFSSIEAQRSAQISLVAQIATEYLTVRQLQDLLNLTLDTLQAVQQAYDLNDVKFKAGTLNELDLRIAESQVHTAQANVASYQQQLAQAENYLVLLIGSPMPENLPAGRPLGAQGILAGLKPGLPSDLLLRRPDILEAEHTLKGANANIGAARAAFFPKITLTGSGGFSSFELSRLFKGVNGLWSYTPEITLPIFAGGSNLANLDLAKGQKRIEIANYEKAIQSAFREVADALVSRTTLDAQLHALDALVNSERRRYELSNDRYRQGVDTYLNVLTAQQDLYTAQQQQIQTRFNRLSNLITLYKALGGGWK